jgi:polar amino acid transport system permease protein
LSEPTESVAITRVKALPRRGQWIAAAGVTVILAMIGHALWSNPRFQWQTVGEFFTSSAILHGLLRTLLLTAVSMVVGVVLGTFLALMRLSSNPVLSSCSTAYVWFFRGTPLLVQLIFFYNISALYPKLSLGIPFGPEFVSGNVNELVTPLVAAFIGLGLNEAAFMSEIIKAGIQSVEPGQTEAGEVLGMTRWRITRRLVLPQAMRFIVPPTANQVIAMLKNTSIVSVIALPELLYSAQIIYTRDFTTIPLLVVASLWYLIVTSVLTVAQSVIERHYSRSDRSTGGFMVPRFIRFGRQGSLPGAGMAQ